MEYFEKVAAYAVENDIDIVADLIGVMIKKGVAEFSNQLGMRLTKK